MNTRNNIKRNHLGFAIILTMLVVAALVITPRVAQAKSGVRISASERLDLVLGKSMVIESPVSLGRASIANPKVADALVLSSRQVYVNGNKIGVTNLTLWKENDEIFKIFDVHVVPDLTGLKEQLHLVFPEEKNIKVTAAHEHITLSGVVSSAVKLSRAVSIAEAYAPEKVVNLLRVGGVQQVMLEVRVAEMNRDLLRRLGVNLAYSGNNGTDFGMTTLSDITSVVAPRDAILLAGDTPDAGDIIPFGLIPLSPNAILRWQDEGADWTGFVDALKENGLVKVLAEPNLVALSGQQATFLAGGEFPFPIPQALGNVTIKFKKFGIGLTFTPVVLADNLISIEVQPEVSELDFTNSLIFSGFVIPSISTRRASTVVELSDGQSFAIAGLIQESVREKISKFPILGEVPVLGALFRSSEFKRNESELIIIVTPKLVKPMETVPQDIPGGDLVSPNDYEFYMMGESSDSVGRSPSVVNTPARATVEGGLEGEFGHVVP